MEEGRMTRKEALKALKVANDDFLKGRGAQLGRERVFTSAKGAWTFDRAKVAEVAAGLRAFRKEIAQLKKTHAAGKEAERLSNRSLQALINMRLSGRIRGRRGENLESATGAEFHYFNKADLRKLAREPKRRTHGRFAIGL